MAALAVAKSLARGTKVKLNDAVVTTGGGAGTIDFDALDEVTGDFSALFQAVGTVTNLVCDLQFSLDSGQGTTFNTLVANLLVAATPFKLQTPLVPGARYRLNITTPPVSADFYVTRS
jgi:hypothetical protein